jgi:dTDP-4-amino-4,6-dideoxygalactose transaminase
LTDGRLKLPFESRGMLHVYNQFVILVKERDGLLSHLKEQGIGTEIYYPLPLHLQACFADLGYHKGDFPVSEMASESSLAIPIYPELTESDQQYVVSVIASFYGNQA